VSFVTNTNWQNYGGETTMSHLTQMAGLAVQNFVSAAVGLAVAVALIRGLTRRRAGTIGNFWVDLTKGVLRVLLPIAFLFALVLISQGVVQNFNGDATVTTVEGKSQSLPGGPVASQESIKELGTNGGGPDNANSAHPFENPNSFTNLAEIYLLLVIPFSLAWTSARWRATGSRASRAHGDAGGLARRVRQSHGVRDGGNAAPIRRRSTSRRPRANRAATTRARRSASAPLRRVSSQRPRRGRRRARSTRPMTASRRSAAPCHS
jgi:hypothetical protein